MSPKKGYGPFSQPEPFEIVAPYREDLVVAAKCLSTWYWLADGCAAEGIAFVLGHALAMKAIHGGKAKNDKIAAHKIASLVRGGLLPQACVYPAGMRSPRDLIRRRLHLVRKRGELLAHIQNTRAQYTLPAFDEIHAVPRFERVQECASDARLVTCVHQSAGKTSPRMRGLSLNRCWARVFDACQRWKRRPH